jgi:hypothetical protein
MNSCSRCNCAELIGQKLFLLVPNPSIGPGLSSFELSQLPLPPTYSCKACLTDAEICKLLAPAVLFVFDHALKAGVRDLAAARASLVYVNGPDILRDLRKKALAAL